MVSSTLDIFASLEHQRYVISIILSFLNEVDGTCMLITNKTTFKRILPIFELPAHLVAQGMKSDTTVCVDDKNINNNAKTRKKARHLYKPVPIQCASVLLDRLNTVRLSKRIRLQRSLAINSNAKALYRYNMTTEEIAWAEWTQERGQIILKNNYPADSNISKPSSIYSSKLELLRYRLPPPQSKTIYNFKCQIPKEITGAHTIPKILQGATVLASYPRSGNTLLRTLLERTTGIVTGSDTRPDRTLSKALSVLHSLVGEGIVTQSKTPIIKTHFPERRGFMMYNASRIILLVRNPYDVIDSYWNMCCTNTHTESVSDKVYERYQEKFQGLALEEIGTWAKFLKYWLLNSNSTFTNEDSSHGYKGASTGPSVLLVRFEDLIQKTQEVLEEVVKFITIDNVKSITGESGEDIHPFWAHRIRRALELDQTKPNTNLDTSNLGSYKPRSHEGSASAPEDKPRAKKNRSIGKSLCKNRYSQEVLFKMHQIVEANSLDHPTKGKVNFLQLLGYDVFNQNFPDNFEVPDNNGCNWDFIYPKDNGAAIGPRTRSTVRLNLGAELRPPNSPFGRAMTRWRRSQTCDDKEPFEFVSKII